MTSGHALSPPTVLHIDSVIYLFILLSVLCVGDQRGQKKKRSIVTLRRLIIIFFFPWLALVPCSTHVTAVPDYVQLDNVRVPEEQQKHAVAIESAENGDKSFGFGGEGATVCVHLTFISSF